MKSDAMDLLTAIDSRSSAVRLTEPAPSQLDIERILQSGVRVPDHGKLAPARFVVLQGEGLKRLGDALADTFQRKTPEATPEQLEGERKKAQRAPVVIVVAARPNRDHKVPVLEQMSAVSAGVQNMFLTAHALGYGAMWKTGGAAYDPKVNLALGLQEDDQVIAFFYLGTSVGKPPVKPSTLDGVVSWLET
jgi:nitroreductase